MAFMHRIIAAKPLEDFVLLLGFDNGEDRLLDMKPTIGRGGVFSALSNPEFFARVRAQEDFGGIEWPNGADYCPNTAYMHSISVEAAAVGSGKK